MERGDALSERVYNARFDAARSETANARAGGLLPSRISSRP
jgi:hypothetical protein